MDRIYTLPEGWSYKELKKIADVITGVSFKPDDITKDGIRILRSGNIQNGYVQTKIDDVFLNDSYFNKQNTIQYLDNCITSSTGSVDVLGKCGTVFDVFEKTQIGAFLRLVRSKDIDNALYISLILHSPLYFQYIRQFAKNGTSINNIKNEHLEDFKFPFPPKDLKERISRFYLSLEKKILLNTYMIAELEAMAKQLYDYWFVQFDFPDENGKPYKSSGGKMVYNEKLRREIPESWEVKNMNQLAESFRGVTYNKEDLVSESENSILVLRGNNIPRSGQFAYDSNVAYIPSEMVSDEQRLNKGDIIITMSSGSKEHIGKCFMFQYDSTHTFGAFLSKFVPHEGCRYYVYLSMLSDYFKAFVKTTCNGTGINNLTTDTFNNVFFAVPSYAILSKFEKITENIYNKVGLSQKTIYDLTNLRDSLLPMLMNGQVTVK